MKNENKFLPLGSIVVLNKTTQKLLIVARGMIVENDYYDYGAFLYPQGLVEDSLVYFNKDQIAKVDFKGFSDDDDQLFIGYIEQAIEERKQNAIDTPKVVPSTEEAIPFEALEENEDMFASIRDFEG
jgi:hypothetical protein